MGTKAGSGSLLTSTVRSAVGNDDRSSGVVLAGLVRAVTDSVGEVSVLAEAGSISVAATEVARLAKHVIDADLLKWLSASLTRNVCSLRVQK